MQAKLLAMQEARETAVQQYKKLEEEIQINEGLLLMFYVWSQSRVSVWEKQSTVLATGSRTVAQSVIME